eukprot:5288497-Lingulodinium_polyedra.AAC.1
MARATRAINEPPQQRNAFANAFLSSFRRTLLRNPFGNAFCFCGGSQIARVAHTMRTLTVGVRM